MEHELKYRAASYGLTSYGISDNSKPHWFCTCGQWMLNRDLRGRPHRETAMKHHKEHIQQSVVVVDSESV